MITDYWSKRGLTTARSGEIIASATLRRNSETQSNADNVSTPLRGSTLHPTGTTSFRATPLSSMTSSSPLKTYHWYGTTSKVQGPEQSRSSSMLRSPANLNAGKIRGVPDFDDGGLSSWEDSFQKFIFSATPSEKLVATDDWKKEFLYQDQEPISRSRIGSGTFGQRNTLTSLKGDGMVSRNIGSQRGYVSDSEDSWNWLETQREKLTSKRALQNLSHQRLNVEDRMNRQSSEVEQQLLADLRGSQSSLKGRASESDLRYRARSMDNVGVNTDDYDITYSKFGPSLQRKGSIRRSRGSETSDGGPVGTWEGRSYQTLPKGARLQGNSSLDRSPLGQAPYSVRTLLPEEEKIKQSFGGASPGGFLGVDR